MTTKSNHITISVMLIFFSASVIFAQSPDSMENLRLYRDSVASMQQFEKELTTKGEWIKIDSNEIDAQAVEADPADNERAEMDEDLNKDFIWRPYGMEADWNPYSYGCWRYTSCGWMWVSYYDFGWTTCHYGRWWYSERYGWVWSPGYIWAPAWTSWCYNGEYIGWEPLSPRVHHRHYHGHNGEYVDNGEYQEYYPVSNVHVFHKRWTFIKKKDFTQSITKRVILAPDNNYALIDKSKIVNDIGIAPGGRVTNIGPSVTEIEKETGRKIETVNVEKFNENNKKYVKDDNYVVGKKVKDFNYTGDATKHEVNKIGDGTGKTDEGNTGVKRTEDKTTEKKKVEESVKKENSKKQKGNDEQIKKEKTSEDNDYEWKEDKEDKKDEKKDEKKEEKKEEKTKQDAPPPVKIDDAPKQKEQPKPNTEETKKNDTKKGDN